jgi:flagellar motor switch protein FliN/FliY
MTNTSDTSIEEAAVVEKSDRPQDIAGNALEQEAINARVLENIPVTISVEVGRAVIKISDLMRLTQGSVVELDRIAGEPLDLLINNVVVAQGEVVLVNDRYGIRLTRVVSAAQRIKNL